MLEDHLRATATEAVKEQDGTAAIREMIEMLRRALRTYLAVRPEAETPALFVSKYRQPLSARAVEHLFHKYLAIARIEDASPHTLRHTMATHMIKSGATLRSVQEMLGHANIQTTSRYVSLAEEQLHKDVQDYAL